MIPALPDYYFRIRENGAQVFRMDIENRQQRIEMDPIAFVNIRNGEIRPQGDRVLSDAPIKPKSRPGLRRGVRCWRGAIWMTSTAPSTISI